MAEDVAPGHSETDHREDVHVAGALSEPEHQMGEVPGGLYGMVCGVFVCHLLETFEVLSFVTQLFELRWCSDNKIIRACLHIQP